MAYYLADQTVTIANGGATSGTCSIVAGAAAQPADFVTVMLPAAWTACTIRLQVSNDDSTWYNLGGTSYTSGTTAASQVLCLRIHGFPHIRLVCSVVQGAERSVILRPWRA